MLVKINNMVEKDKEGAEMLLLGQTEEKVPVIIAETYPDTTSA